ncbi:MAG TPA: hypothetical protein VHG72_19125 [Polyangia bacterium]|nr:hypothetical protein [Polyangia bacterium]
MGPLLAAGVLLAVCGLASCAATEAGSRGASAANSDEENAGLYWTTLTVSYHGQMSGEEDDEAIEGGIAMGGDVCDPEMLGASRACARPEAAGDLHEIRCQMKCKPNGANAGPTLVRATLFIGGRPVKLQLDRVDTAAKL